MEGASVPRFCFAIAKFIISLGQIVLQFIFLSIFVSAMRVKTIHVV